MPNTTNGLLSSPLNGALIGAQQPATYSVSAMLAPPQAPLTPTSNAPTLPVFGLVRSTVTVADALVIAQRIGAQNALTTTESGADGAIVSAVQLDGIAYTMTVYGGYGTAWFTLQALDPGVGVTAPPRLLQQANAWLSAHNLLQGLQVVGTQNSSVSYGQNIAGMPLLGVAARLDFDGQGILRDLRYEYALPRAATQEAARSPALAATDVVDMNQGMYSGPDTSVITGVATIDGMYLAYAGVRGATGDYLEPIYVLTGIVPTRTGPASFDLYTSALQFRNNNQPAG